MQLAVRLHKATSSGALAGALRGGGLPVSGVRLMSLAPLAASTIAAPATAPSSQALLGPAPPDAPAPLPGFSAPRDYCQTLSNHSLGITIRAGQGSYTSGLCSP